MAIQKSILDEKTGVTINYIRIEFLYVYNEKNSEKCVFCRIGKYTSKEATKMIDYIEKRYSFQELEYTGAENIYSLIYNKLVETDFVGAERID